MPRPLRKSVSGQPGAAGRRVKTRKVGDPSITGQAQPVRLRMFKVGEGLPDLPHLVNELNDMQDVLMGRTPPPDAITEPLTALYEVAEMYYARAAEISRLLKQMEREGHIRKGSAHYHFRTGELRDFLEMVKRTADLGSRRITAAGLLFEQEQTGRESKGFQ